MSIETPVGGEAPESKIKFENGLLKMKMDLQRSVMTSMLGEEFNLADHDEKNRLGMDWISKFSHKFRELFLKSVEQDEDFASKLKNSKDFFNETVKQYESILLN